jgi:hypothetical protein
MTPDFFATYRELLLAELRRTLEGLSMSHGAVLRDSLSPSEETGLAKPDLTPALVCLLTADALGAWAEPALPGATSLALLALMTNVLDGLRASDANEDGPLMKAWGMPRLLNAGDGLYALAQDKLHKADLGGNTARKLAALELLDKASRLYSEVLYEGATASGFKRQDVHGIAAALGGVSVGATQETAALLLKFGETDKIDESWRASIPDAALEKLKAAADYIAEEAGG